MTNEERIELLESQVETLLGLINFGRPQANAIQIVLNALCIELTMQSPNWQDTFANLQSQIEGNCKRLQVPTAPSPQEEQAYRGKVSLHAAEMLRVAFAASEREAKLRNQHQS